MNSRKNVVSRGGRKALKKSLLFQSRSEVGLSLDHYADSPVESDDSEVSDVFSEITPGEKPRNKTKWWRRLLSHICPCLRKSRATPESPRVTIANETKVDECRDFQDGHKVVDDVPLKNSSQILEVISASLVDDSIPAQVTTATAAEEFTDSAVVVKADLVSSIVSPVVESDQGKGEPTLILDCSGIVKVESKEKNVPAPTECLSLSICGQQDRPQGNLGHDASGYDRPHAAGHTGQQERPRESSGQSPQDVSKQDSLTVVPGHEHRPLENSGQLDRPEEKYVKDGDFFLSLVTSETERLVGLSAKATGTIERAEEVMGNLRSAKGQTDLLTANKFETFKNLCETNLGQARRQVIAVGIEQLVTDEDLLGFWCTVEGLVEGVDQLYKYLDMSYQPPPVVPNIAATKKMASRRKIETKVVKPRPARTGPGLKEIEESRRKFLATRKQALIKEKELEDAPLGLVVDKKVVESIVVQENHKMLNEVLLEDSGRPLEVISTSLSGDTSPAEVMTSSAGLLVKSEAVVSVLLPVTEEQSDQVEPTINPDTTEVVKPQAPEESFPVEYHPPMVCLEENHPLEEIGQQNQPDPGEIVSARPECQPLAICGPEDRPLEESGQQNHPEEKVKDGHFFLALLANEKDRLIDLSTKSSTTIQRAEDVIGNLRSAKGQTDLLISNKFQTFKKLCEANLGQTRRQVIAVGLENLVTNEDLLGFYSTVEGLVEGVDKLYKYIDINYEPPPVLLNTAPIKKKRGRHKVQAPVTVGQIKPGAGLEAQKRDEGRRKLLEARKQVMLRRKKELKEELDGLAGYDGGEDGRLDESSGVHTSS